jgi:hypothetical protein
LFFGLYEELANCVSEGIAVPTFASKLQLQLSLLDSTFEEETTEQKTNQKKDRHRDTETWISVHSKNGSKSLKTITLDWSRWNQLSATTAA